jgi:D-amino-acid dehydrogenase
MLAEDGECDLGYAQVGGLYVPTDPDELDHVERRLRARATDAPEAGRIDRLSPAEAGALFPPLRPDQPAVLVSGGARVDGQRLTAALRRAAAKRGTRLVTGSAELLTRGDRALGVRVDGELIEAEAVVVAAGAWRRRYSGQPASTWQWRPSAARSSTCACPAPSPHLGRCCCP